MQGVLYLSLLFFISVRPMIFADNCIFCIRRVVPWYSLQPSFLLRILWQTKCRCFITCAILPSAQRYTLRPIIKSSYHINIKITTINVNFNSHVSSHNITSSGILQQHISGLHTANITNITNIKHFFLSRYYNKLFH